MTYRALDGGPRRQVRLQGSRRGQDELTRRYKTGDASVESLLD